MHVTNIYIPAKNDISSWLNKYWVTPSWEMLSPFFLQRVKTGLNRSDFQKQQQDCEGICGPQNLQTSIKASRLSPLSEKPRQWPCFRCEHYTLWHIQFLCASHQWAGREQRLVHGELVYGYMSYLFRVAVWETGLSHETMREWCWLGKSLNTRTLLAKGYSKGYGEFVSLRW